MDTQGNAVTRGFDFCADRLTYDFADAGPGARAEGWNQFDTWQDASYFGVWVNPGALCTFTLCEGDTTLVECPSTEAYAAELERMRQFYASTSSAGEREQA